VPKRTGTAQTIPRRTHRDASPSHELPPRTVRTSYGSFINPCIIDFQTASDDPALALAVAACTISVSGNLAPDAPALLENVGRSIRCQTGLHHHCTMLLPNFSMKKVGGKKKTASFAISV